MICVRSPGQSTHLVGQCRKEHRKAGDEQQRGKCLFWHYIYDMVPTK